MTKGMERLADTWDTARVAVAPRLAAARETIGPLVDEASARMTPVIDRLGPTVDTARTRLREDVVPAVAAAVENSAPARAEARERATAALLALRGQERHRVRRWPIALGCLIAGAAAGLAAGAMTRRGAAPVQPTPFAAPTPTTIPDEPRDATAPYPAGRPAQ